MWRRGRNIQHDASRQFLAYSDGELLCVGLWTWAVLWPNHAGVFAARRKRIRSAGCFGVFLRWTETAKRGYSRHRKVRSS